MIGVILAGVLCLVRDHAALHELRREHRPLPTRNALQLARSLALESELEKLSRRDELVGEP